ncbi:MAG: BBP7 family outer membrane beta-barrel protein [Planctomycetia bacterium]
MNRVVGRQCGPGGVRLTNVACAFAVVCTSLATRPAAAFDLATPPAWRSYAVTEALVMGRDNQASDQPLVSEVGAPDNVLLATPDLQFPFGGGLRVFAGSRVPDTYGWEIGYFGLYGQSASASASTSGTTFLEAPGPLGYDLTSAAQNATITWNSTITSAEANVFRTATDRARSGDGWWTVDWLAGFRYIGVEETAALDILSCGDVGPLVPYRVGTSNNLFGGQIGTRARLDRERWAFEGWAKAGLLGNAQTLRQPAVVDWLGYEQRPAASTSGSETSFVGDLNLSAIYRLSDVWGIRAGYNTIWIGGVALAPDQFTFGMDGPRDTIAGGSGIFLHGVNIGIEARW